MNWSELARAAKSAGFGGFDLTVRKRGHVMPERVKQDLPKAVETIRQEGLEDPHYRGQAVHYVFEAGLLPLQIRRCPQGAGGSGG